MNAIAQCTKCKIIYKFIIIGNKIPPCPKCKGKGETDDGGFLINGLNPDNMYSTGSDK